MSFFLVSPKEVDSYIEMDDILFIDMRDKREFEENHIKSSIWLTAEELEAHIEEWQPYRMVILYCHRGNQSLRSAREISARYVCVGSIAGGYNAYMEWKQHQWPYC